MAKTVHLSSYTTANDGLDDSPGLQQAVDDLKADGGGTVIFDDGTWDVNSLINFSTYGNYISFRIVGDKGAVIKPHLGASQALFYSGNTNQIEFKDLVVIGDSAVTYDAKAIIYGAYTPQIKISGCVFYGVGASLAIVYAGVGSQINVESSQFNGNATGIAAIYATEGASLSINSSTFLDYQAYRDKLLSKTPWNSGVWIKIEGLPDYTPNSANSPAVVRIEDVQMDEGGWQALMVKDMPYVKISGLRTNVSGTSPGTGMILDNVKRTDIEMSSFGYAANARPAITAINGSVVNVLSMQLGGAVFPFIADKTSTVILAGCIASPCARVGI